MALESKEQLDDSVTELDTPNNISRDTSFVTTTDNLTVCKQDNRKRSLRSQNNTKNRVDKVNEKDILKLTNRPQTPTELISGMTSFTFSNYFTPCIKDHSPLPTLSWADSNEVWETMLQKDKEYKRDSLYIRKHPSLQPRMRSVLLDWLIEVS